MNWSAVLMVVLLVLALVGVLFRSVYNSYWDMRIRHHRRRQAIREIRASKRR